MSLFEKSPQFEQPEHYLDYSNFDAESLELEQLLEAGRKTYLIIIGNLAIGLMTLLLMWNYLPKILLTGWTVLLAASILLRIVIVLNYQKVKLETLERWKAYFISLSLFSGLIWGAGAILMHAYIDVSYSGIEAFIIGGLASGAIVISTSLRGNYPDFAIPMLSALIIYFLLLGDMQHLLMAGMLVVFIILMGVSSITYRKLQFDKHIMLQVATESKQWLQNITSSMGEGVFVVDKAGVLTFINPESEKMLGWSFDELKEDIHAKVHVHDQNNPEECLVKRAYLYKKTMHSDNEQFKRKDGTLFPVSLTASPIRSIEGKDEGTVVVFQDITLQKELEEKLARAALHDALTGLYNRGHFDEKLKDELERAQRYERSLSLLILDIDLFKKVNVNYGHQAGDEVLKSVAALISSSIRKSDYAARYGGEEFAVILPETDPKKAVELAERIRMAVEQKGFKLSEKETVSLTISIGIGSSSKGASSELLIKDAYKRD